jgi:predicted AlkP superfamily pyrophosphatase or phosphodiesterase
MPLYGLDFPLSSYVIFRRILRKIWYNVAIRSQPEVTTLQYPDYDHSIVSVSNSILRAFGAECRHKSLPFLDAYLDKGYHNVLLMLFDGMGTEALEYHLPKDSFLRRHVAGTLSSVFPPTTSAALPSIESGLTPYEHGWLGWSMYFQEIDSVVDLYPNTVKDSGGVQAAEYHVARKYLPYETIGPAIERAGIGKMYEVSPYNGIVVSKHEELFDAVCGLAGEPGKKFVYAYWNQPDSVMHKTGCRSERTRDAIRRIDQSVRELCLTLSDTLIIVIADHGHIDTRVHIVSDSPKIQKALSRPVSIESRAAALYVKDKYQKSFPKEFRKAYGKDFLLLSRDEVLKSGLFGSGTMNARFVGSIGDFLAIAVSDAVLLNSHESKQLVSNHAGLTEAEMRVPLILVEKPAIQP